MDKVILKTKMNRIILDEEAQKICYINRDDRQELTFDEAKFDESDTESLHFLDNEGNFYITDAGVNYLNNKCNEVFDAWSAIDGFFPHLENPEGKWLRNRVYINIKTTEKLSDKIFKGLEREGYTVSFGTECAAWLIKYQSSAWRKFVIKAMKDSNANDILAELNRLFAEQKKIGSREIDKMREFISAYQDRLDHELLKETDLIFEQRS